MKNEMQSPDGENCKTRYMLSCYLSMEYEKIAEKGVKALLQCARKMLEHCLHAESRKMQKAGMALVLQNTQTLFDESLEKERHKAETDMKPFLSACSLTVEEYLRDVEKSVADKLLKMIPYIAADADFIHSNPKKEVRLCMKRIAFHIKRGLDHARLKWFSVEHHPKDEIEQKLGYDNFTKFRELLLEAFEKLRKAQNGVAGKYAMGELPIVFCGHLAEYLESEIKIITLGQCPSADEFPPNISRFREKESDFDYAGYFRPTARPWEVNNYLKACSTYFDRSPNWKYYNRFLPFLKEQLADYTLEKDRRIVQELIKKSEDHKVLCFVLLRHVAIHIHLNTPVALDKPWKALSKDEQEAVSCEKFFPALLDMLAPDIILCDFDPADTWLVKDAKKIDIPQDWEMSEKYAHMQTYLRGTSQYVCVLPEDERHA